jgi:hypothetical protein
MSSSVKHAQVALDEFERSVVEYYKTKQQYEEGIKQILERRRANGRVLTRDERKTIRIGNCTVCNGPGMTFSNSDGELRVRCNTNSRCRANQLIRKPVFHNIETLMNDSKRDVDEIKEHIIHLKLNLLFGYASDDDTLSAFNKLQSKMTKAFDTYDQLRLQYYDIVSNSTRLKQYQDLDKAVAEIVNKINLNLSPREAVDVSQDIVRDMVKVYRDQLLNTLEMRARLKYSYSEVVADEDYGDGHGWHMRVNRMPICLSDLVIPSLPTRLSPAPERV